MKKILIIWLLLTIATFSQTSVFTKYFQNSDGTPATGKTIVLIPQASTYPADSLKMIEYPTRPGMYYRVVPNGEYKIYINAVLYLQHYYITEITQQQNYLQKTGSQSGVTAALQWSNGSSYGVLFGDENQVGIPYFSDINDLQSYRIGWASTGLHFNYASGIKRLLNQNDADTLIAANYSYNLPEVITNGTDTINFTTDRNFVKSIMSVAEDNNLDLYFANSGYGSITIWVIGGWNPSGTIIWNTSIAGETLMWVGGVEPPLDTSTSSQLFIINFTKGTSTIIVGQWNYVE